MFQELKTVDWEGALRQVNNDSVFLDEVFADLVQEALEAQNDIDTSLTGLHGENNGDARCSHFTEIRKAAHRIRGSAAYLCCDALIDVSFKLQEAGHSGSAMECIRANSLKTETQVLTMFKCYKKCLADIQEEIEKKKGQE